MGRVMSEDMTENKPQQYNAIFADRHFEQIKLGKLLNKGGAAGKVYEVLGIFMNGKKVIQIV